MLKQGLLIASVAAATLVAIPGAAEARHRPYYYGTYGQPYYGAQTYGYYPRAYHYRSYGYDYRPYGYGYRPYDYGYRDYGYGRPKYGHRRYHYGRRGRCGSGTTGLIVGGAAGALLGREIDRSGRRYRYYGYRRDGTTGAIVGGAIGALVGREIARSC